MNWRFLSDTVYHDKILSDDINSKYNLTLSNPFLCSEEHNKEGKSTMIVNSSI